MNPEDIRLAIAVTHAPWDPDRRANLAAIAKSMGGMATINAETVYWKINPDERNDPKTRPSGPDKRNGWVNVRRSWEMASWAPGATHAMELHDDMVAVPGFWVALKRAIASRPDDPINFFTMYRVAEARADAAGVAWISCPSGMATNGGSIVMPVALAREFLTWQKAHMHPDYPHDDRRLGAFLNRTGKTLYLTVPCLLDHLDQYKSVQGNRAPFARVAALLPKGDASEIDWTKGLEDPFPVVMSINAYPDILEAYRA